MSAIETRKQEYQPTIEIFGTYNEQFSAVREAFARNLDTGQDIGASVALCIDGEMVVDLWGGYFDATYTRPWQRDTIVQTFSTTETIAVAEPELAVKPAP